MRRGTAKSRGCSGPPNGWSSTTRSCSRRPCVYINSDGNGRGFFEPAGSHTLEHFVNEVARSVEDPETKGTVWKRWQARQIAQCGRRSARRHPHAARSANRCAGIGIRLHAVSPARRHGVAESLVRRHGSTNGIYHSIYDDFYHYEKFSDPGFLYGRALAQFVGTAVVRLADADLLPFEFTNLADTVQTYVTDLQNLLKQRQDDVRDRNRQIEDGVFAAINDPRRPRPVPAVETVPPALNFAPLENASRGARRGGERGISVRQRPLARSWLRIRRWRSRSTRG